MPAPSSPKRCAKTGATILMGVTKRQRTERGFTHVGPILYPARDALLALARGPLDNTTWEHTQAAGSRLDLAAAVTVALEQLQ